MWPRLKQYWWILVFYGIVIVVITISEKIAITINKNTIILLIILLLPLIIPRLSKLEYGSLKFELRELRNEVVETKQEARESYLNLNKRLVKLTEKSADYLKPQPLQLSDEKAEQMRKSINLSIEEVELGLNSLDPNLRIPAYIELQTRPRKHFFHQLLDCFWLEQFLARRQKETRPLWQLLVATGRLLEQFPELTKEDEKRTRCILRHTMEFLNSDDTVDSGKECERRIDLLIGMLP